MGKFLLMQKFKRNSLFFARPLSFISGHICASARLCKKCERAPKNGEGYLFAVFLGEEQLFVLCVR